MTVGILIVDDEPDVADLFRQRFRREVRDGTYSLHFAGSGEEVLPKLADGVRPQLIVTLSDINMPGIDGLAYLGRWGRIERGKWLISFDRTLEGLHYIGDGGRI
jgi:CheY-like chemotaxis protein